MAINSYLAVQAVDALCKADVWWRKKRGNTSANVTEVVLP